VTYFLGDQRKSLSQACVSLSDGGGEMYCYAIVDCVFAVLRLTLYLTPGRDVQYGSLICLDNEIMYTSDTVRFAIIC